MCRGGDQEGDAGAFPTGGCEINSDESKGVFSPQPRSPLSFVATPGDLQHIRC